MQTFLRYFNSALPLLGVALILGAAAYFIALALLKRRGARLSDARKLWLFVSAVYVFSLVMLLVVRGEGFSLEGMGWYSLDLFHEYRSLARSFTANAFINILMNILIFLPFGFLFALPFGESKRRWLVLPLGLAATLAVELIQFAARSGIADVDDIFNNSLGVLCGFALARAALNIRAKRGGRAALCALAALVFLSPPFAAWGVSAASPYGVSGYQTGGRAPLTDEISFSGEALAFLDAAPETYEYYSTPGGTLNDARGCASAFFARFGTAIETEDLYDDMAYFRDGPRYVSYHYAGPVVEYCASGEAEPTEEGLRALLADWGLDLPGSAAFEELGPESYRFSLAPEDGRGGTVDIDLHGSAIRVTYSIFELTPAGGAAMLSTDEIAAQLRRGAYAGWVEDPDAPQEIASAAVEYELDSKGVCRPLLRLDFGPGDLYLDLPAA